MLIAAAAAAWGVPASEIVVAKGVFVAQVRQERALGDFAEAASKLEVSEGTRLAQERLPTSVYIGKTFKRLDTEAKVTGQPIYTQDVHLDGMVVVSVVHPPRFGGVAKSIDASLRPNRSKASSTPRSSRKASPFYATSTWPAFKAKGVVNVEWDEEKAEKRGSAELLAEYRKLADQQGAVARNDGDADAALASVGAGRRGGVHLPVFGARGDGANERGRQVRQRHCPHLERIADADNRSSRRRRDLRRAAGQGAHRHEIRRRFVRPSCGAERALPRRSRDGGEVVG